MAQANAKRFKHPELDSKSQQTRFLQARGGAGLNFSMHVGAPATEQYVALSYTWGSEDPSRQVNIDKQQFHVRRNLYYFLREFCFNLKEGATANIWIDAICIDQENINERNHQVRQMLDIYRKARFVITWLDATHLPSVEFCRLLVKFQGFSLRTYWYGLSMSDRLDLLGELKEFCDHSYWSRLWIVPEVLAATDLHLWCGSVKIEDWQSFASIIAELLQLCQRPLLTCGLAGVEISTIEGYAWIAEMTESTLSRFLQFKTQVARDAEVCYDFVDLLLAYGRNGCSDRRDCIFALRALSNEAGTIDYRMSIIELFFDVLERYLSLQRPASRTKTERDAPEEFLSYSKFVSEVLDPLHQDFHDTKHTMKAVHFIGKCVRIIEGYVGMIRVSVLAIILRGLSSFNLERTTAFDFLDDLTPFESFLVQCIEMINGNICMTWLESEASRLEWHYQPNHRVAGQGSEPYSIPLRQNPGTGLQLYIDFNPFTHMIPAVNGSTAPSTIHHPELRRLPTLFLYSDANSIVEE